MPSPTGTAAPTTASSRKRCRDEPGTAALKARIARREEAPPPPAGAATAVASGGVTHCRDGEPDTTSLIARLARRREGISPPAGALSGKHSGCDEPDAASRPTNAPLPSPDGLSDKRSRSNDEEGYTRAARSRASEPQRSNGTLLFEGRDATQPAQQEALVPAQGASGATDSVNVPAVPRHTTQGTSGVCALLARPPGRVSEAARRLQHDGSSTAAFSDSRKARPAPPPPAAAPVVTLPVRAGNPVADVACTAAASTLPGNAAIAPAGATSTAWSRYSSVPCNGEVMTPRRVLPRAEGCAGARPPPIRNAVAMQQLLVPAAKPAGSSPKSTATTASTAAAKDTPPHGDQYGVPTAVRSPPTRTILGDCGVEHPSSPPVSRPSWRYDASQSTVVPAAAASATVPRAADVSASAAARISLWHRMRQTAVDRTGEAPAQCTVGATFSPAGAATAAAAAKMLMPVDPRGWMSGCFNSTPSPGSMAPYLQHVRGHAGALASIQARASAPDLASLWRHGPGGSVANTAVDHHGRSAVARGFVAPLAVSPGVLASPRWQTFGGVWSGAPAAAQVWPRGRSADDMASAGAVTGSGATGEASGYRDPFRRHNSLPAAGFSVHSPSAQINTPSIPYVPRFLGLQPVLGGSGDGGGGGGSGGGEQVAARTAHSTGSAREGWTAEKHGLALFTPDTPAASTPSTSSTNHTHLDKRETPHCHGAGESSSTTSVGVNTNLPKNRLTSMSSRLLSSSGDTGASERPAFSHGLSGASRSSSDMVSGERSLPAARASPSAFSTPTSSATSVSTPLSEGVTDARPAAGGSTTLSESAADARPRFVHQLVMAGSLGHGWPVATSVCSSLGVGMHPLVSPGGRVVAGAGDVATSRTEYHPGVAAPALAATRSGPAAENDAPVSECSPQSGAPTATDRGDEACHAPLKAVSKQTTATIISEGTVSPKAAAKALEGGPEHAATGVPHGSGGVPAKSVASRPTATHEGEQAEDSAGLKEALLRRGIRRAEILHLQFRGSGKAGAAVRGDDELSRLYLGGEKELRRHLS